MIIGNSSLLMIALNSFLLTIFMFVFLFFFYKTSLRKKSETTYDEVKQEIELSMMRASFEKQISELNREMTATKTRWKDVNSLILSGQEHQNKIPKELDGNNEFLSSYGIDPNHIEKNKRQVFVLTPFSREEREVFITIRNACNDIGLHAVRGDEIKISGDIMRHIIINILESEIIIANISSRNPNVFFELGISMALGKKTIIISKINNDIPFDLSTNRIILFSTNKELRSSIRDAIQMNFLF